MKIDASLTEKIEFIRNRGWIVGKRDFRINTKFSGKFMVCEPYDDSELPSEDGSNGPWAIVGDDLSELVETVISIRPPGLET